MVSYLIGHGDYMIGLHADIVGYQVDMIVLCTHMVGRHAFMIGHSHSIKKGPSL